MINIDGTIVSVKKTVQSHGVDLAYTIEIDFTGTDAEAITNVAGRQAAKDYHLRRYNLASLSGDLRSQRVTELKKLGGTVKRILFTDIVSATSGTFDKTMAELEATTDAVKREQLTTRLEELNAQTEIKLTLQKTMLENIAKASKQPK